MNNFVPPTIKDKDWKDGVAKLNELGYGKFLHNRYEQAKHLMTSQEIYLPGNGSSHAYIYPKNQNGKADVMNRTVFSSSTSHLHLIFNPDKKGADRLQTVIMTVRVGEFDSPDERAGNDTYHPYSPLQRDFVKPAVINGKINGARDWWASPNGQEVNNNVNRIFEQMKLQNPNTSTTYYAEYQAKWLALMEAASQCFNIWFAKFAWKINEW